MELIYEKVAQILKSCGSEFPNIQPTILYNEGWMLRLLLFQFSTMKLERDGHPLAFLPGSIWFSEALLPSLFLQRYRGDPLSEAYTHADGVIGHFTIGGRGKGDCVLKSEARHFVVTEAKIFSGLSSGVTNDPYYHQAARNTACMVEMMRIADIKPEQMAKIGFFVLAPKSKIEQGIYKEKLDKEKIINLVKRRIEAYGGEKDKWFAEWFLPAINLIQVEAISWEELIGFCSNNPSFLKEISAFYESCLQYNG